MKTKPFRYSFKNCGQYLLVHATGTQSTVHQVKEYAKEINSACEREGCGNVLLDEREVSVQTSIEDDLELSNFMVFHHMIPDVSKLACVPNSRAEINAVFFQWLARAKHIKFRAFQTTEEAAEWLIK